MSNIVITIIGISFIFLMTTLGSAVVFFFKKDINNKINSLFLGFASGIMIAASVWSLLLPSIDQSSKWGDFSFLPATIGIITGAIFLVLMDKVAPYFLNKKNNSLEPRKLNKSTRMFLAVTLHNIPEGLAVGLAFGNAFLIGESSAFYAALWLDIGIGIQNFPEGSAISLPMKQDLGTRGKSFLYGVLSGVVEPIMAVIGVWLSTSLAPAMPWFLAFAAGAMIFVVADELLPDSKNMEAPSIGSWGFIIGFVIMMILDVALG